MIQTWEDIPGFFDFRDVYHLAVENANQGGHLVEVGSFLGKSVAYLSRIATFTRKDLSIYAVDAWAWDDKPDWWKFRGDDLDPNPHPWPLPEVEGMPIHEAARYCINAAAPDVKIIRKFSGAASQDFKDGSVDFVFIDANHNYDPVRADIAAWLPKVRSGGIIAGHDYTAWNWPGVKKAVDEAFGEKVQVIGNSWVVRID